MKLFLMAILSYSAAGNFEEKRLQMSLKCDSDKPVKCQIFKLKYELLTTTFSRKTLSV